MFDLGCVCVGGEFCYWCGFVVGGCCICFGVVVVVCGGWGDIGLFCDFWCGWCEGGWCVFVVFCVVCVVVGCGGDGGDFGYWLFCWYGGLNWMVVFWFCLFDMGFCLFD